MTDVALTPQQEQWMRYLDDQMPAVERAEFERRLLEDPELAAETARFQALTTLAASVRLQEPTDREIRRFWARFYNRTEWQLGWILFLTGLVVLLLEGISLLVSSGLPWHVKCAVFATFGGGALLAWNTLRLKLKTSRFDRYRGILR